MLDLSDHFFVPERPAVELRAFTHGLMPKTVPDMMDRFVEDWKERGVDAWNEVPNHWRPHARETVGWWSLPDYLGDAFIAPMLNASAETCILQPNVHWTMQCLLSSPEPFTGGRNEIVLTDAEFPSVQHSVRNWATLRGYHVTSVPLNDDGFVDVEHVANAITDRTAWVFISHVGFTTGEKLTNNALKYVADVAHQHDTLFGVDGYHATGSSVINVPAIDVDVYFGGLLKEACGSTGNSYLYLREGLSLTPRLSGWFSDDDPFGFHREPQPNASVRRRFLAGTSAVASFYHAVEGLRILEEIGYDKVRQDSLEKTDYAIQLADRHGIRVCSPREDERRGAMVILQAEEARTLCDTLRHEEIFVDSRQNRFIRLAPFVWNTTEDIERAFDVIGKLLHRGEYVRNTPAAKGGPVT